VLLALITHAIVRAEARAPHLGYIFSNVQASRTPPGKYIIDYFNMVLGNEDAYVKDLQYTVRGSTAWHTRNRAQYGNRLSSLSGSSILVEFDILAALVLIVR
jgi:hypothetical protein